MNAGYAWACLPACLPVCATTTNWALYFVLFVSRYRQHFHHVLSPVATTIECEGDVVVAVLQLLQGIPSFLFAIADDDDGGGGGGLLHMHPHPAGPKPRRFVLRGRNDGDREWRLKQYGSVCWSVTRSVARRQVGSRPRLMYM